MKRLAALILFSAALPAQQYKLGPDSQPVAGVPKGQVTRSVLKPGALYPGTPHDFAVYLPANADPSKPLPFMIFMDGKSFLGDGVRIPVVLDNLIARGDLPPMAAIFVDPGVLPTVAPDTQNRFERIFEYDSLSDRFSRFLLEELIPEAEKLHPLSHNPDDCGLAGISTGAVAAFVAAWNRPDQFHRVLSLIGTFIAMKGSDSLPALIRKREPLPIRVYMQDGNQDHTAPAQPYGSYFAGNWPIANQTMYEDLLYAGYDVTYTTGDGGHDLKQGGAIMPDALRWLWRGYPDPIVTHDPPALHDASWDPRGKVRTMMDPGKPWVAIATTGGPITSIAPGPNGDLYLLAAGGALYRVDDAGKVSNIDTSVSRATTAITSAGGTLYLGQPSQSRIITFRLPGLKPEILTGNVKAVALAASKRGIVYFVDEQHHLGYIDTAKHIHLTPPQKEFGMPSSLGFSPDQSMLLVADAQSRFSWSFQIGADGAPINGEPFYRLELPESGYLSHTAGVTEDSIGQVYFATPSGIQMCEANGRVAAIFNAPERGEVAALAFAGIKHDLLYTVVNGNLYRRPVKIPGNDIDLPVQPPKPPL